MKCPIDDATLVISERNGVEIDYCPSCRGVWLDRGELDKIIERSDAATPVPQALGDRGHDDRGYERRRRKKSSASFLSELFDF